MTRRRFKLIGLAILLLVAIGLSFVVWLSQPDAVQPDKYERIRLGMSLDEVEAIVGLKAGFWARSGAFRCTGIHQEGRWDVDEDEHRLWWVGKAYAIHVSLNRDGRTVGKSLSTAEWNTVESVLRRFGFGDPKARK